MLLLEQTRGNAREPHWRYSSCDQPPGWRGIVEAGHVGKHCGVRRAQQAPIDVFHLVPRNADHPRPQGRLPWKSREAAECRQEHLLHDIVHEIFAWGQAMACVRLKPDP